LSASEVRQLVEILDASARLMATTASDDRVIDIAKATLVGAAEDWARMLRRELIALRSD
jgi:hypothetical protein